MRVCQKVKEKGTTSYNEVADELVLEESEDAGESLNVSCDQKNIRRRVYDALNVLMAMNIISKEKKEIKWLGLPTSSVQECEEIEIQNQQTRKRIEEKQQQLRELVLKVRYWNTLKFHFRATVALLSLFSMCHSKVSSKETRILRSEESFRQQTQPYICHLLLLIQIRKLTLTATYRMISK